ncbi:hypothetical protein CUJ83_06130 [Methanocella sp. CWC-04]|uniref:Pyrrolo-quinoline quinone repeat domain-containing protein n=1 Tax=Methanooceanicella nereidis TaxID=2052831 RepID=A0AAP2RC79_9EURY|nr:PQQ-binding-like beta-propeller repeat protein [Methanocella sp. CWC-04]MCD1294579.1 hypothetical protein [Methanocella sp. CWC-04]
MQSSTALKAIAVIAVIMCLSAFALMTYRSGGAALIWQLGDDDPVLKFFPANNSLYVIGASNISLVNSTGSAIWTKPFANTQYSETGDNGELYAYSRDQGLVIFYPDGTEKPVIKTDMTGDPVIGTDGTLYLRSWGMMSAVSQSGDELWNVPGVISDPVTDLEGYVYYFQRPPEHLSEVYLYCKSPDSMSVWSALFEKYYSNTVIMSAGHDGIYVYNDISGEIYRIDHSGNLKWQYYKPYLGQYRLLVDDEDRLYLLYLRGTVHVLDKDGNLVSKFNHDAVTGSNTTHQPAINNDTIYMIGEAIPEDTAVLYALNMDGSGKWKTQINCTGPAKVYAEGSVICVTTEIKKNNQVLPVIYVIDEDGDLKYTYHSEDGRAWEQVYIKGNMIYAKTYGGKLYALKG